MESNNKILQSRYFQKRKGNKVVSVARERYVRNDLGFGVNLSILNTVTNKIEPVKLLNEENLLLVLKENGVKPLLFVLDTNIVLGQLDLLELGKPKRSKIRAQ